MTVYFCSFLSGFIYLRPSISTSVLLKGYRVSAEYILDLSRGDSRYDREYNTLKATPVYGDIEICARLLRQSFESFWRSHANPRVQVILHELFT